MNNWCSKIQKKSDFRLIYANTFYEFIMYQFKKEFYLTRFCFDIVNFDQENIGFYN